MLRLVELALFLLPFALFAAWWFLGVAATPRLMWAAGCGLVLLAGVLVWFGTSRQIGPDEVYEPAHVEDGRIIHGGGVRVAP